MMSYRQIVTSLFVFFPIYGQFAAIWKPDSGRMVYKTYIYINNFIDLFILQNLKAELENL